MVSSARQAIGCILIIFAATVCTQSQTVPAKGPTATIAGKVTVKGKGISGIVVGLRRIESSSQQGTRYKAVTDEQGNYRISNVPPGNYQVVTSAPAYISDGQDRGKTLIITKEETIENIDFALVRGAVITGKVIDSEGRPVVEEQILLHSVQTSNRFFNHPSGGHTDDRGIYRIYGVPPGVYRVSAGQSEDGPMGGRMRRASYKLTFHPAAADVSQAGIIEVTEGSEATNIDITVGRPLKRYSARGRIVDGETGKPLANVPYGLQIFSSENHSGSMTNGAVTNSEGEFKLENLSLGKYAVFIEWRPDNEWRADPVRFEVSDGDVTGLLVTTSKGASASGVVVLEGTDDKAVHAAMKNLRLHAYVMNTESNNSSGQSPTVNPDGSFRVNGLPAGLLGFSLYDTDRFQVARYERDGVSYPKGIEIKEGEHVSGVRVVLNYGNGTIRGVVKVENGTLPANIYVSLRRIGDDPALIGSRSHQNAQVDARGHFLQEYLVPGTYEVTANVYSPESRAVQSYTKQQVVITGGSVTTVTLMLDLNSTSGRP